jgi:spermidine/putrescine transport system permease protein
MFYLPAVIPGLLTGIALIILIRGAGLVPGMPTIIIGHAVITFPFVVLTVCAQLERFDRSCLDAARDLGAGPVRAAWDITFPLVRTAVIGGMLITCALSLDEFVVTFFINGNTTTVPILIWGMMRLGIDPTINAVASLILIGTVIMVIVANRASKVEL